MQIDQLICLSSNSWIAVSVSIKIVSNLFLAGRRVVFWILKCKPPFTEKAVCSFSFLPILIHLIKQVWLQICWSTCLNLFLHQVKSDGDEGAIFLGNVRYSMKLTEVQYEDTSWLFPLNPQARSFWRVVVGEFSYFCWLISWVTGDTLKIKHFPDSQAQEVTTETRKTNHHVPGSN